MIKNPSYFFGLRINEGNIRSLQIDEYYTEEDAVIAGIVSGRSRLCVTKHEESSLRMISLLQLIDRIVDR